MDLSIRVFLCGDRIPDSGMKWALSHTNGIVKHWSQLDNIIARYSGDSVNIDSGTRNKMLAESMEQLPVDNDEQSNSLKFLAEQLKLVFAVPQGRRYSTEMLIRAFTWYHKSTSCYVELKRLLILLSLRMLRDVASYLNVGQSNTSLQYLTNKAKYLHPHELLVTIQLDEIHIQPRTSYQCGKLTGGASNCEQKTANRIQAFMLSSVLSNNKDVVSLIPVQKMQTEHLFLMTKEVIRNVTLAGYRIVCILSDNNVVNRKMFMKLSGTDHLVSFIMNPIHITQKIFLMFDTVHLLKCVRNNWINDIDQTFTYPDFDNCSFIRSACFRDLITIYYMEKDSVLKDGYLLTLKSLFPNSIERQNVKLVLKIFDRTTVAALETLGHSSPKLTNWESTAIFIRILLRFWNIVNVKTSTKGIRKRLDDAKVISSCEDERLIWLTNFSSWLKLWRSHNEKVKSGHLTKETFTALSHTVDTLVMLVKELLHVIDVSCVLSTLSRYS